MLGIVSIVFGIIYFVLGVSYSIYRIYKTPSGQNFTRAANNRLLKFMFLIVAPSITLIIVGVLQLN